MSSTRTRIAAATFVAAAAAGVLVATPAQAATPDTACMQAGIKTLQGAGLISSVAKNGVTVGTAVSLGVTARDGLPEGYTLDTVISFPALLADHRAGSNSVFVYPWCS
jgi:hypothetical protein